MCPILVSSVLVNLLYKLNFLLTKTIHKVCLIDITKRIFCRKCLIHWYLQTFSQSMVSLAVTDKKVSESWSKIKDCELILSINGSQCQNFFFLRRKQGKPAFLPKISVNVPYFSQLTFG